MELNKIEYEWIAGSMPPPHHYEWKIIIESTRKGHAYYIPDYSGTDAPVWEECFDADESRLNEIYEYIKTKNIYKLNQTKESGKIGGTLKYLGLYYPDDYKMIKVDNNEELNELLNMIKQCVPEKVWEIFRNKKEEYDKKYLNN